jgi:lipopolysaccharide/colanic/teichoic acid biosynthesis glycosyltransferase
MSAGLACRCAVACVLLAIACGLWSDLPTRNQHLALTIAAFVPIGLAIEFTRVMLLLHIGERWQSRRESVLILGSGRRAQMAWHELRVSNHRHVRFLGFVDDCDLDAVAPDIREHFLCSVAELPEYLLTVPVDTLVVAKSLRANFVVTREAVGIAEAFGIRVLCLENIFELGRGHLASESSYAFMESIKPPNARSWRLAVKYGLDRVLALLLLMAVGPLLVALSLAIKCIGEGPVVVSERRYGAGRRPFRMLTLNTSPECGKSIDREGNSDAMVCRFGQLLRRTYLDRLPRLWNVLRGEMSLIGPEAMETTGTSPLADPAWSQMFRLRPGLCRPSMLIEKGARTPQRVVAADLLYLQRWSLWADAQLVLRLLLARRSDPGRQWSRQKRAMSPEAGAYSVAIGDVSE